MDVFGKLDTNVDYASPSPSIDYQIATGENEMKIPLTWFILTAQWTMDLPGRNFGEPY